MTATTHETSLTVTVAAIRSALAAAGITYTERPTAAGCEFHSGDRFAVISHPIRSRPLRYFDSAYSVVVAREGWQRRPSMTGYDEALLPDGPDGDALCPLAVQDAAETIARRLR